MSYTCEYKDKTSANFRSYERFKIHKILPHKIPLYVLCDEKNRVLVGLFNEFELTRVNLTRYRVVVRDRTKKKGQSWVRLHYKGYSDDYDEWKMDKNNELVDIVDEQTV